MVFNSPFIFWKWDLRRLWKAVFRYLKALFISAISCCAGFISPDFWERRMVATGGLGHLVPIVAPGLSRPIYLSSHFSGSVRHCGGFFTLRSCSGAQAPHTHTHTFGLHQHFHSRGLWGGRWEAKLECHIYLGRWDIKWCWSTLFSSFLCPFVFLMKTLSEDCALRPSTAFWKRFSEI